MGKNVEIVMEKKMKKNNVRNKKYVWSLCIGILSFWVFLISAPPLQATFTEAAGMGIDKDTSWMKDKTYPFVFLNPAAMQGLKNSIYFEYYNTIQMGGIFLPITSKINIGVFSGTTINFQALNSTDFQSLYHTTGNDPAGINFNNIASGAYQAVAAKIDDANANALVNRNLETILTYRMGSMKLGLGLSYGFASDGQSEVNTNSSGSVTGGNEVGLFKSEFRMAGGLIMPVSGPFSRLASSIAFTKYNVDNFYIQKGISASSDKMAKLESDAAFDIELLNRATMTISRKSRLHIFLGYAFLNRSTRTLDETNSPDRESQYERLGHRIRAGASHELALSNRLGLFYGVELGYEIFSNKYEATKKGSTDNPYETSVYQMRWPIILGLSSKVSKNFDIRMGIRHNIINSGDNFSSKETKINGSTTVSERASFLSSGSNISMGLSYDLKMLRLDWLTNIAILKEGPYFISGKANAWSTAFAVLFNFDGLVK